MKSVNIAELKNGLSKYLRLVRQGEEIVIRDRNLPIARILPFDAEDLTGEELALVAAGKLRLPTKKFDVDEILAIGKEYFESHPLTEEQERAIMNVVSEERDESDDALLLGL